LKIDPLQIIEKFYGPGTRLYDILVNHSRIVRDKSLDIARSLPHLNPDLEFIETAAMLHDIGIFLTRSESIGCFGKAAYVCHGYLGRELLDELGLPPEYGMVSERHTGAGITRKNIVLNKLPLPQRDMVPLSLEEKIICAADKYHSKNPRSSGRTITTAEVIEGLRKINSDHAERFTLWAGEFGL
jgi:uncharacterized protein